MTAGGLGLRQYGRKVRVSVGQQGQPGRSWTDLRFTFSVTKTDSKKPDKAKVQIYNLGEDSRGFIQQENTLLFLFAGYEDIPELIFRGNIDEASVKKDGRDIVMEIEAGDGRVKFQQSFLVDTYDPPLNSETLIRRIAQSMGMQLAHFPDSLPRIDYVSGFSAAGPSRDVLDNVTESIGASWTIQEEELVITAKGESTPETAFVISPRSGLVGRPEKMKKGVKVQMLLNGKVKPRRLINLESEEFNGFFLCKKVEHKGDSGFGSEFYTEVECVEP